MLAIPLVIHLMAKVEKPMETLLSLATSWQKSRDTVEHALYWAVESRDRDKFFLRII